MEVRPETAEASTVVVRPSFPWPGHRPGQYLRIGVELNGIRHWRAYSLTSDPDHPDGLVSITVKHVAGGKISPYFTRQAESGSMVFLGEVEGEFRLPDPTPDRVLCISAGSGVTPIWSMLRDLERRDALSDVFHLHCSRTAEEVIFGDYLRRMNAAAHADPPSVPRRQGAPEGAGLRGASCACRSGSARVQHARTDPRLPIADWASPIAPNPAVSAPAPEMHPAQTPGHRALQRRPIACSSSERGSAGPTSCRRVPVPTPLSSNFPADVRAYAAAGDCRCTLDGSVSCPEPTRSHPKPRWT
jgi:hypothetical protein